MNRFNEDEFNKICEKFNVKPYAEEININYTNSSFFNKVKKSVDNDRRGEVVFCVIRPNGNIITVTCEEYPQGIFRIPTGGIGHNEDIVKAVFRETREELGIDVEITDFIGVLKLKFIHGTESVMFYSYLFVLKETGGRLLVDASDDEISEIKEVNIEELEIVVNSLNNIQGRWRDWGKFRYETTNAILRYLKGDNL